MFRPIDVARRLHLSTSALRHYEAWGLVPPPERTPKGYRVYTELHVAYFECIRAMYPGFGMNLIRTIMPLIQNGRTTEALWHVLDAQVKLHQEKRNAEQALRVLEMGEDELDGEWKKQSSFTIGEAAHLVGVPPTTIRHWEKEGLIRPRRNPDNGYRIFDRSDIRKLLIIRTLSASLYSLEKVGAIMREFDAKNLAMAKKIAKDSLSRMDALIKQQIRGIHYLHRLCVMVERRVQGEGAAGPGADGLEDFVDDPGTDDTPPLRQSPFRRD